MVGFILKAFRKRELKKYGIYTKSFCSRQTFTFTLSNAQMKMWKCENDLKLWRYICGDIFKHLSTSRCAAKQSFSALKIFGRARAQPENLRLNKVMTIIEHYHSLYLHTSMRKLNLFEQFFNNFWMFTFLSVGPD